MTPLVLTLDVPTLLNRLYRVGNGRVYKTDDGSYAWSVLAAAREAGLTAPLTGDLSITTRLYYDREPDLDSADKALWDALQQGQVVENDRLFVESHRYKAQGRANPRLELVIERPPRLISRTVVQASAMTPDLLALAGVVSGAHYRVTVEEVDE